MAPPNPCHRRFVFSALGIYPMDPCSGTYELGRPLVSSATLTLSGGATLRIVAEGQSADAKYVSSIHWEGRRLQRTTISHAEITGGGTLRFVMSTSVADFRRADGVPLEADLQVVSRNESAAAAVEWSGREGMEGEASAAADGMDGMEEMQAPIIMIM